MHGRNIRSGQDLNHGRLDNHRAKENSPKHSCWVLYLNHEAAMLEGVVSRDTPPLKVIICWLQKACLAECPFFFMLNGINSSLDNNGRAPIL